MREYIECTFSYNGLNKIIFEDHTSMLAKYASQLIAPAEIIQKISNIPRKKILHTGDTEYLER